MKEDKNKNNPGFILWGVLGLLLVLIFFGYSFIFGVFDTRDVPFQFLAALLGVVITAMITQILLKNQSKQQEELRSKQEESQKKFAEKMEEKKLDLSKQSKVFEKRLEIYQDYLQKLCEAIEDGELSRKNKLELQFHTSYIAMHTSPKNIKIISDNVANILQQSCSPKSSDNKNILLKDLFNIVKRFRNELYPDEDKNNQEDENMMGETIRNFEFAYNLDGDNEDSEGSQSRDSILSPKNEDNYSQPVKRDMEPDGNMDIWNNAINRWENEGLIISKRLEENNELYLDFRKDIHGKTPNIRIIFWRGNYIIQADYPESANFTQILKWNLPPGVTNSKRSYWQWWTTGNDQMREIQNGELFEKVSRNPYLQQYLINIIDDLIFKIRKSKVSCEVWRELDKNFNPDYSFWERTRLFEFSTLYTESINETEEGRIFIDLIDSRYTEHKEEFKNKPILLVMDIRDNKDKKVPLKKTLEIIGLDNVERYIHERVLLESFTENTPVKEIAQKLNDWMNRIQIKA